MLSVRLEASSDAPLDNAATLLVEAHVIAVQDDGQVDCLQVYWWALLQEFHNDVVAIFVLKLSSTELTLASPITWGRREVISRSDKLPSA